MIRDKMRKRKFKFRAWDIEAKKMIHKNADYQMQLVIEKNPPNEKQAAKYRDELIGFCEWELQYFIIMEMVDGLQDIEENDIFEDDIMIDIETKRQYVVKYDNCAWHYVDIESGFYYQFISAMKNMKKIGNIHENGDLLNDSIYFSKYKSGESK
jgi:hypothetical protein